MQRSMVFSQDDDDVDILIEEKGGTCSCKDKAGLLVLGGEAPSLSPPPGVMTKVGTHARCLRGSQPTQGRQSERNSLTLPAGSKVHVTSCCWVGLEEGEEREEVEEEAIWSSWRVAAAVLKAKGQALRLEVLPVAVVV